MSDCDVSKMDELMAQPEREPMPGKEGEIFHIRAYIGDHISRMGSWTLPSDAIDNYKQQENLGWTIMHILKQRPDKIEIVMGDVFDTDLEEGEISKGKVENVNGK